MFTPLAAQIPPHGGATALTADLRARRAATLAALGTDAALVLWSAPRRVYSTDTDYEFRQESNLLYLTGVDQPDTTLVLVSTPNGPREFLFIRAADPFRELWEGRVLTSDEAREHSGVQQVFAQRRTEAFDQFIAGLFGGGSSSAVPEFSAAVAAAGARLFLLDRMPSQGGEPSDPDAVPRVRWARTLLQQFPTVRVMHAAPVLLRQRSIKTGYEQNLLRRSVEISAEAHVEGMKAARPGRWEYEVEAAIEHWFHTNGALSWGYPSIVASGPNATTLHYNKSTRQMKDGDLLLVDAAGNYQGLTGDITRTYPVNGRFTPEQRALYELVLRSLEAAVLAATPGADLSVLSQATRRELGAGLLELGLVTDPQAANGQSEQISWWFPHSPTHGIGTDVHDPLYRLDPGAAFVIEPGLYIRPDTIERLSQDPRYREAVERLRPAVQRYANIGIRIEDSFIMTSTGPELLSGKAPKRVVEIEKIVGAGR
jgi:Xaa-Pro aminopeptidase